LSLIENFNREKQQEQQQKKTIMIKKPRSF